MHEVHGADAEGTLAKQLGTILMLERVIEDMAWGLEHRNRSRLTAHESGLRESDAGERGM